MDLTGMEWRSASSGQGPVADCCAQGKKHSVKLRPFLPRERISRISTNMRLGATESYVVVMGILTSVVGVQTRPLY
jgi:hypothetical protein